MCSAHGVFLMRAKAPLIAEGTPGDAFQARSVALPNRGPGLRESLGTHVRARGFRAVVDKAKSLVQTIPLVLLHLTRQNPPHLFRGILQNASRYERVGIVF